MLVAKLGDIIFEISEKKIMTINNVKYSASASIQNHQIANKKSIKEYTGSEGQDMSFSFKTSKYLGSTPESDIYLLKRYVENGNILSLTFGNRNFGKWLLQKYDVSVINFDRNMKIIDAEISVSLKEY